MLMVIFGAGASYDSCSTYPPGSAISAIGEPTDQAKLNEYHRPPLAKNLFANRPEFIKAIDAFAQCKPVLYRLRDPAVTSGKASIEIRLREIEEEAKTYKQGRQEVRAIRCYLARVISQSESNWQAYTNGVTNYLHLLREIRRIEKDDEPVCLVTFNYDTLLESALAELDPGFAIKQMDDYTRRPVLFRLFKLHGSVDWGHEVEVPFPANLNPGDSHGALKYLIEHATEAQITNRIVRCDPGYMRPPGGYHALFPAIAIPVEKKNVFECPEHMIEELRRVLPEVTTLIMIGWRATEEHFLELLKEHLRPGVYVSIVAGSGKEAEEIGGNIAKSLRQPSLSPENIKGFTEFILSRRAEAILHGNPPPSGSRTKSRIAKDQPAVSVSGAYSRTQGKPRH